MLNCGKDVFYCDSEDDNIIDPEYFVASETLKIVDEAKKDIYSEITRIEQALEEEQGELNGMDYHEFYHRIKPKIKKWFGE